MGGIEGIIGRVRDEWQLNENGPEGAGLVISTFRVDVESPVVLAGVTGWEIPPFSVCVCGSAETDREATLVFRRVYPPSVRAVALGTLHPFNRPLELPILPIAVEGLISATALFTFPLVVALSGIFLFFLFFKLKSSLPTLEVVDPVSSMSSSDSDDSKSPEEWKDGGL
jgi:hypothetical protein